MARLASKAQNIFVALGEVSCVSGKEKASELSRRGSIGIIAMPRIDFLLGLFRHLQRTPYGGHYVVR